MSFINFCIVDRLVGFFYKNILQQNMLLIQQEFKELPFNLFVLLEEFILRVLRLKNIMNNEYKFLYI